MAWPVTLPQEGERKESPSLTRLKRPIEGGSNQDARDLIARNGTFRDLSRTNPRSSDVAVNFCRLETAPFSVTKTLKQWFLSSRGTRLMNIEGISDAVMKDLEGKVM